MVAPLAGSVDRNIERLKTVKVAHVSLPSRGAWIEMVGAATAILAAASSLPSRGAWIEMFFSRCKVKLSTVAPLAGSVDRNLPLIRTSQKMRDGRSPRGERG